MSLLFSTLYLLWEQLLLLDRANEAEGITK